MQEAASNLKARGRRTAAEMKKLKEEFEKSGLTILNFSRFYNISTGILYRWKNQGHSSEKKTFGFAKVNITRKSSTCGNLFAEVKGIKLYQVVSASYLKELIS